MNYTMVMKSWGWIFLFLTVFAGRAQADDKVVVAHRAASGYLMEHNLPSVTLAVAMGSDYIEQDLVMTKDDQVIVLHDLTLERVTNVAAVFPGRNRPDGKFYALDFTLAEIKQLHLKEPYSNSGNGSGRFPDTTKHLQLTVPTFQEELELLRGLEKTLQRDIGIYPEIRQPWLHRREGKDISRAVLTIMREYGYTSREHKVYLQCFDPDELQRIHDELLPLLQMDLKLVQLIDDNNGNETKHLEWGEWIGYNYDWIISKSGLRAVSAYVAGIGMDKSMLVDEAGNLLRPELVRDAQSLGMVVHAFTFRREKESLPPYVSSFEALLDFFYFKVGVDGVFTDYCGDVVAYLDKRPASETKSAGGETAPPLAVGEETRSTTAVPAAPDQAIPAAAGSPDAAASDSVPLPSSPGPVTSDGGVVPIAAPVAPPASVTLPVTTSPQQ